MVDLETLRNIKSLENIDEAYVGNSQLKKAEEICDRIVEKLNKNPECIIMNEPEAGELDAELKKVFGVKDFCIYWSNDPLVGTDIDVCITQNGIVFRDVNIGKGPYTFMSSALVYNRDGIFDGPLVDYDKKRGVYDKHHVLTVIMCMECGCVTKARLNAKELLAIIIHEVGHNFDFTPMRIIGDWLFVLVELLVYRDILSIVQNAIVQVGLFKWIPVVLDNIEDIVIKFIPPVYKIVQKLGKFAGVVLFPILTARGVIDTWSMISKLIVGKARFAAGFPLLLAKNFFGRKGEEYADSLATTYGYGTYLLTGLDKFADLHYYGDQTVISKDKVPTALAPFFDIMAATNELVSMMLSDHGSDQQRALKQIYQLERDLKNSNYPPKMKRALEQEIKDMKAVYNKYISIKPNEKQLITKLFRQLVDTWYNGKPYLNPIEKINMVQ